MTPRNHPKWRNGDRVISQNTGAKGTVTAVRRAYIIVTWDDDTRKRWPMLPERTKLKHSNYLRLMHG